MKIDEVYQSLSPIKSSADSVSAKKSDGKEESSPEVQKGSQSGTQVELSTTSVEFSKVTAMMDSAAADRVEKVNQIRDKITNGQYEIDATRTADKILEQALFDYFKQ